MFGLYFDAVLFYANPVYITLPRREKYTKKQEAERASFTLTESDLIQDDKEKRHSRSIEKVASF
jgi:hypothetical protein